MHSVILLDVSHNSRSIKWGARHTERDTSVRRRTFVHASQCQEVINLWPLWDLQGFIANKTHVWPNFNTGYLLVWKCETGPFPSLDLLTSYRTCIYVTWEAFQSWDVQSSDLSQTVHQTVLWSCHYHPHGPYQLEDQLAASVSGIAWHSHQKSQANLCLSDEQNVTNSQVTAPLFPKMIPTVNNFSSGGSFMIINQSSHQVWKIWNFEWTFCSHRKTQGKCIFWLGKRMKKCLEKSGKIERKLCQGQQGKRKTGVFFCQKTLCYLYFMQLVRNSLFWEKMCGMVLKNKA